MTTPIDRRSLFASAAVFGIGILPTGALAQAISAGTVESLRGTASASRNGATRKLVGSGPVYIADRVETDAGARLALKLGQRTMLRLGEKTSVSIDEYLIDAGGEIVLDDGALLFERVGPPAKSPLSVRSPYGLIAVRGTTFFAGPSNGVFGVFVSTGRVTVTGGNRTVTVAAGQGTDIARPGARPTPPKTWAAARVQAALRAIR